MERRGMREERERENESESKREKKIETDRDTDRNTQTQRERLCERVCVCVCDCVCRLRPVTVGMLLCYVWSVRQFISLLQCVNQTGRSVRLSVTVC